MVDTWDIYNFERIKEKLAQADSIKSSNMMGAYKIYDDILQESSQHKINDEQLAKLLVSVEISHAALFSKVEVKIAFDAAEKKRIVDEKAKREAAELQRIADEERRAKTAEEERLAKARHRAEAVVAYRTVPKSAFDALNVVKKLSARTEIGINYQDYSRAVGEAWGEVKVFIESPDGKHLPDLSILLAKAIADHKSALNVWNAKFEYRSLVELRPHQIDYLQQQCWMRADKWARLAESLLDSEKTDETLAAIAADQETELDFDAELSRLLLKGAPNK